MTFQPKPYLTAALQPDGSRELLVVPASALVRAGPLEPRVHPEHGPAEIIYSVQFSAAERYIREPETSQPRGKTMFSLAMAKLRLAERLRG